ncbi:putative zinc metalloprotease [Desarmillaria tabescens]|uniref:Peptide hydrolase n=1 Tax=Armillaria tabescens TaxID=1929756 RepID=A0AA39TNY7_ARMTA|nr:putative zinc metalloprotease [Desarmillaria tabescens]KAK0465552.1 putative zinc metalloprotease [Desarmillaria tabescens]
MTLVQKITSVFAFRSLPTTVLTSLIYLAILISVLVTDDLPAVPKNRKGLDLDQAYSDLHKIAERPHPYNSHANDAVRSFILGRVHDIAAGHKHVHIADDMVSNGSWASGAHGVYFEGTNILVKIDGTEKEYTERGGVLFSAHYDSVSTAPGATDDGMGVATLLQLVEFFAKNRPKRTAVFNINNGEEDWLNGAHAFLVHPWSNITDTFLNLEGAASGGRPTLFRATSSAPLLSFLNTHVPHPHANVLSQDAFARGVIRSATDYEVYSAGADIDGLDLAFYKGRSKYHTKFDAIPYTVGQTRALWAMMEAARGSGVALVNDDGSMHRKDSSPAVYFDLFGAALILFPLSSLFTFNVVLLAVGPVVLILLLACEAAIRHNRRNDENGSVPGSHDNFWGHLWNSTISLRWLSGFWRWSKFWFAILVTVGLQVLLVFSFVKINTFTVHSSPYLVFLSSFTLAYLSIVPILQLPIPFQKASAPEQQKQTVLLQMYFLTWVFLLLATIAISKASIGGVYFVTGWNALVFLACCVGCVEGMLGAEGTTPFLVFVTQPTPLAEEEQGVMEAPTETTPLIPRTRHDVHVVGQEETGAIGWWILQMLIVVPVPVISVAHIAVIMLSAMPQTLSDGSSAVTVYAAVASLACLMVLPIAPFSFKLHRFLAYIFGVIFVLVTLYSWFAFPFSQEEPLKVYFLQNLTLSPTLETQAVTTLAGASEYIMELISHLPSASSRDISCNYSQARLSLQSCSWTTDLIPSPGGNHTSDTWLQTNVTRLGTTSARISVQGRNTRSCRIYFETNPIIRYDVHGGSVGMQPRYEVPEGGIKELRIWSRTWDRNFTVDVEWGRVACEWNEYESGSVGVGTGGRIPALEEVLTFLPNWAVVTKMTDGLVEVSSEFRL